MKKWGLQSSFKGTTLLAMAGAMALVIGTAACGGGGGSSDGGGSKLGVVKPTDGYIAGATMTCNTSTSTLTGNNFLSTNNSNLTEADGSFTYDTSKYSCVTVTATAGTGSTDLLTGANPKMVLKSPAPSAGGSVYPSPLTTMLQSVPAADLSTVMNNLFGSSTLSLADVASVNPYGTAPSDATKAAQQVAITKTNLIIAQVYNAAIKLTESSGGVTISDTNAAALMDAVSTSVLATAKSKNLVSNADKATMNTVLTAVISNIPTASLAVDKTKMTQYVDVAAQELATNHTSSLAIIEANKSDLSKVGDTGNASFSNVLKTQLYTAAVANAVSTVKAVIDAVFATDTVKAAAAIAALAGQDLTTATAIQTALNKTTTLCDATCQSALVNITAVKGFGCANNTVGVGISSPQSVTYGTSGALISAVTGVGKNDVTISCNLRGFTSDDGKTAKTNTYTTSLNLYMKDASGNRMINATLAPVTVSVTGSTTASSTPSAATITVPTTAKLVFNGRDSNNTAVNGSLSNLGEDLVTMSNGALKVNTNSFLTSIQTKVGSSSPLNVLTTAGTFKFELGFGGIHVGYINGTTLSNLVPSISGTVTTF
ncbi:MAG: hypothetical protein H7839_16580 [Magnetococcus sp. YQC-5]